MNGRGNFLWNNDTLYVGKFIKSKLHGKGKLYFDQKVVSAVWENDKRVRVNSEQKDLFVNTLISNIKERKGKRILEAKNEWEKENQMAEESDVEVVENEE